MRYAPSLVPPGGLEPPVSAFVARRPFQSDRGGVAWFANDVERSAGFEPARGRLEDGLPVHSARARGRGPSGDSNPDLLVNSQTFLAGLDDGRTNAKLSLSTESNGPLPGTGRVRRHQHLRGIARRPSHQTTADLQTCDTRSASACFPPDCLGRRTPVGSRWPPGFRSGACGAWDPVKGRPRTSVSLVEDRIPLSTGSKLRGQGSNLRHPG